MVSRSDSIAGLLCSKRGANVKMYKLNAKMYDLLPVSWARSGVRMLSYTISCRCLGLEAGSGCYDVQVAAGILGSKRGPNAKMYDCSTTCCRCLGLDVESMLRCTF